jgi:RimJ/RimL family protein N-acetyltransferase
VPGHASPRSLDWRTPLPPLEGPRLVGLEAAREHERRLQGCLEAAPGYFLLTEGTPAAPGAAAHLLDEAEADPTRRILLLTSRRGGRPLGVLDLWLDQPEPGTAHVGLLLLAEPHQGQGLGAEAAAALERSLAAAGYAALRLSVGDENPGAHAFWARVGYAPIGRLDGGVTLYEKVLVP